jgi:hypothetical protein
VPFAIQGIDASEIEQIRISNSQSTENDVLTEAQVLSAPPSTWSLTDPAYGGTSAEGIKVVYVQWKDDRGRWSNVLTGTIVLSSAGRPNLAVVGGTTASSPEIEVRHVIPGALVTGVAPVLAYSCNALDWVFYTQPTETLELSLVRADAGCPAGEGPRTLHFRWRVFPPSWSSDLEAAVHWSSAQTLAVTYVADLAKPTATAPAVKVTSGGAVTSGMVPLTVVWSGSDAASGIARYELGKSTDGGPWTSVTTSGAAASRSLSAAPGHTYRFRVRAVDKAGNVSAWTYGATFTLTGYSEANSRIVYSTGWSSASTTSYWGGRVRYATASGARATATVTGRSFSWVSTRGPSRGKARVYVNGTLVATVDLYAASTSAARVVYTKTWSTSATRTVRIHVLGTAGRPRVDLDGVITLR